jgi:hypothetical protein
LGDVSQGVIGLKRSAGNIGVVLFRSLLFAFFKGCTLLSFSCTGGFAFFFVGEEPAEELEGVIGGSARWIFF